MEETKKCKHCQTDIPKKAKICPNCRKKQSKTGMWIAIVVVVILIIGVGSSGGSDSSSTQKDTAVASKSVSTETKKESKEVKQEEVIEYESVTVAEMKDQLDSNAMKAKDMYDKKYLEISGRLANIDSDGKYISIVRSDDQWAIMGVQCYIKGDDQKSKVMDMNIGDEVVIKVKIKDVGEVLGYQADIMEIE